MAVCTLVNRGRVDNIVLVMHGLTVADDGVVLTQVLTHVYFVDHQRHVDRVAGVRINALGWVVTEDAQADLTS